MTKTDIVKDEGGQYVTVDAPIDRIPLFVRKGSILPMIEQIMYADAADGMKLKLNVYTGKDAVLEIFLRYSPDLHCYSGCGISVPYFPD